MSWQMLWGCALAVVAAGRTGAQLRQIRRAGSAGVSEAGLAGWFAVNVAWVGYTLWVGLSAGLVSESCYVVGSAALVAQMYRDGALSRRGLLFGALVAAAYAGAAGIGAAVSAGPLLLGIALTGSVLCYGIPALVVALRSRSVVGLSRTALTFTVADGGLALGYGIVVNDQTYAIYGVIQQVLTLPVLVRVRLARLHPQAVEAGGAGLHPVAGRHRRRDGRHRGIDREPTPGAARTVKFRQHTARAGA